MNTDFLKKIGLSDSEVKIYGFLIDNPMQTLMDISNTTNINRPMLYRVVPYMIEKWLIVEVLDWKRKKYMAENPKVLRGLFNDLKNDFESYLPWLEKSYFSNFDKPIIKHFSWKSWVKNVFIDIWNTLNKWDVFYRYSSRKDIENTSISSKDYQKYKDLRSEKKLERMVITSEYLESFKSKRLEKDVVVIPKEIDDFGYNITKIIYASKVAIIDYNTFESFIIENPTIASFEKKLFLIMFKMFKK